jgi:hypothetical protein
MNFAEENQGYDIDHRVDMSSLRRHEASAPLSCHWRLGLVLGKNATRFGFLTSWAVHLHGPPSPEDFSHLSEQIAFC